MSLFVALEGAQWKIAKLRRQGFVESAAIDAGNLDEAEIRYFTEKAASVEGVAEIPAPKPSLPRETPRPTYSSTGSTIGFVGHRGEN